MKLYGLRETGIYTLCNRHLKGAVGSFLFNLDTPFLTTASEPPTGTSRCLEVEIGQLRYLSAVVSYSS